MLKVNKIEYSDLKKSVKLIFLCKKMKPKLVVLHSWEKLQFFEKNFFENKKNLYSLIVQIISSKCFAEIFLK